MVFLLIEDKELTLAADESLPLQSLKAHFHASATGLYYISEEGREQCKHTLIYISVHNLFLMGLLVTNEIITKPNGGWPSEGLKVSRASLSSINDAAIMPGMNVLLLYCL